MILTMGRRWCWSQSQYRVESCFGVEGIDEFCLRCFVLEVPVKTMVRHVYEVVKYNIWIYDWESCLGWRCRS